MVFPSWPVEDVLAGGAGSQRGGINPVGMLTELKLKLPKNVYARAKRIADLAGKDLNEFLSDTIGLSLAPLGPESQMRGDLRKL